MSQIGGVGGEVDGGRELAEIAQKWPALGRLIDRVLTGVNAVARNSAASATGETAAPKPPDSVNVTTFGEYMHVAINHSGPINRGIRYFTEVAVDDPSFARPIVIDHGSSRTSHPFPLPTTIPGGASHKYYVRCYAQYAASQPSASTTYGGASNPTPVSMSGITAGTPLPSYGSGTAANTGQQASWGLGKVRQRGR